MKVKLTYDGNETLQTKEVDLPQVPRVGDGFCIILESEEKRKFIPCIVKSVDWWIENGKFKKAEIFLIDE
ncbi:hypothetical protein ACS386_14170 [Flavobacteriaceae bacterium LMO-SS05]